MNADQRKQFLEGVAMARKAAYLSPQHSDWADTLEAVVVELEKVAALDQATHSWRHIAEDVEFVGKWLNSVKQRMPPTPQGGDSHE